MTTLNNNSAGPLLTSRRLTRLLIVVIALVAALGVALDWPIGRTALVMGVLAVGAGTMRLVAMQRQLAPLRHLGRTIARISAGEADAVITDLSARRAAGDRAPEVLMGLASAYSYQGRGPAAAAEARDALAALTSTDTCGQNHTAARLLCETAHLLLFDARLAEGRFEEAAEGLRVQLARLVRPTNARALAAWGYFLAGNDDAARDMLLSLPDTNGQTRAGAQIDPRYRLIVAYMRAAVLHETTRGDLRAHQDQLAGWQALAARNAQNPYGARLSDVLDDLRRHVTDDQPAEAATHDAPPLPEHQHRPS